MSAEIRQLVADCLAEQPDAMQSLVARFRGRVLGLCYRMLGQWQDAEDVAQETFLAGVAQPSEPGTLIAISNLGCWRSPSIAVGRFVRGGTSRSSVQSLNDGQAADPHVRGQLRAAWLAEEVERALSTLPPAWVEAFHLFHREGLDYQQIAVRLGRPVGTVKTWVHRSRLAMLEQLRRRGALME